MLFTDEPCILHWPEAMSMLRESGMEVNDFDDLNGAQVGTQFVYTLDHHFFGGECQAKVLGTSVGV